MSGQLLAEIAPASRLLTAAEFHRLADVPPEVEWFANLSNPSTRRAYENAIRDFMRFTGIARPQEFRTVTRAHIIAWRDELKRRGLGGSTIRHRLASLASLFEYLCEKNAVTHNPVKGVERPRTESGEGKTPALGDHQARELLAAPQKDTIKSKRDRAILSTLLFHALRREELCKLKVRDFQHARKGVPHLRVSGKGGKTRYLPLHPGTHALIHDYLDVARHGVDENGALFRLALGYEARAFRSVPPFNRMAASCHRPASGNRRQSVITVITSRTTKPRAAVIPRVRNTPSFNRNRQTAATTASASAPRSMLEGTGRSKASGPTLNERWS